MNCEGLIAGLGNPGKKYEESRHNCGYMFIDALLSLARQEGGVEELNGKKFNSLLWRVTLPGLRGQWLAAKPLTFMNESGRAIQPLLAWYNLRPDQCIVAQDELDIPPGALRFKFGGGLAGHNGLRSIAQQLGTPNFYRLRIGIGKPVHKSDMLNWVLGRPDETDLKKIRASIEYGLGVIGEFSSSGPGAAMQLAHGAERKLEENK